MPYYLNCIRCNDQNTYSNLGVECGKCNGTGRDWRNDNEFESYHDWAGYSLEELQEKGVLDIVRSGRRRVFTYTPGAIPQYSAAKEIEEIKEQLKAFAPKPKIIEFCIHGRLLTDENSIDRCSTCSNLDPNDVKSMGENSSLPSAKVIADPTKVFISYSRNDAGFVDLILRDLKQNNFNPIIDIQNIEVAEKWWERTQELISESAALIFIISPESVRPASVCLLELKLAKELSLPVIPVFFRSGGSAPEYLSKINWIDANSIGWKYNDVVSTATKLDVAKTTHSRLAEELKTLTSEFQKQVVSSPEWETLIVKIRSALSVEEILWRRESSDWLKRAQFWHKENRPGNLCLRDGDMRDIKNWVSRNPTQQQPPTLITEFLTLSEAFIKSEKDNLRKTTASVFIGPAQEAISSGQYDRAIRLLATAALKSDDMEMLLTPNLKTLALQAVASNRLRAVLHDYNGAVFEVGFLNEDAVVLTVSDNSLARLSRSKDGKEVYSVVHFNNNVRSTISSCKTLLATWGHCDELEITDAVHNKSVSILKGHDAPIICARFSRSGDRIATGSKDHTLRIWDIATGDQASILQGPEEQVTCVSFSPDDEYIFCGYHDGSVQAWSLENSSKKICLPKMAHSPKSITFGHGDTEHLVVVSYYKDIIVWNSLTDSMHFHLKANQNPFDIVKVSADGTQILTIEDLQSVALLRDLKTGKVNHKLEGASAMSCAEFCPMGARVLTSSANFRATIWDARSGVSLFELAGHEGAIMSAAFSQDGKKIITGSWDQTARIWDARTTSMNTQLVNESNTIYKADKEQSHSVEYCYYRNKFSAEERPLVTFANNNGLGLYGTVRSGKALKFSSPNASGGTRMSHLSPENIIVENFGTREKIFNQELPEQAPSNSALSADGSRVMIGSSEGFAIVWDVDRDKEILNVKAHKGRITNVQLNAGGSQAITIGNDNWIKVWDIEGQNELYKLYKDDRVEGAVFSPNSNRIGIYYESFLEPIIWDLTKQSFVKLCGHLGSVNSMAFSPDGKRIATASHDLTVRIWDAKTGNHLKCLSGHVNHVTNVWFPVDGLVISESEDGTVRFWSIDDTRALTRPIELVMASNLANGMGKLTEKERETTHFQGAFLNIFEEYKQRLKKSKTKQIRKVKKIYHKPLNNRCYLSPTQFIKKTGLLEVETLSYHQYIERKSRS